MLTFDREAGRYRDQNGELIPESVVFMVMEGAIRTLEQQVEALGNELRNGSITNEAWLAGMTVVLDNGAILLASVAAGGHEQVTAAMWLSVAAALAVERRYLRNFEKEIRLKVATDSIIVPRSKRYVFSIRQIFQDIWQQVQVRPLSDPWCKRIRTALESCKGCVEWANKGQDGWMPYSQMARIGTLQCKQYCRCYLIFREGPPAAA